MSRAAALFQIVVHHFAEAERHRIRERIGQVKADQKARGRNLGGKVPFGYPADLADFIRALGARRASEAAPV